MSKIKLVDVVKCYRERRTRARDVSNASVCGKHIIALDHVNFDIEEGEMVCIIGPSGAGKSTLLRIIAGHTDASEGLVLINDQEVDGPSRDNIFVYQENGLLPWYSTWDNVALGLRHIEDDEERNAIIQEYIDVVELTGFEHHYPHQLSGGMQRRAELARALAVNPDVLFLDEPFTGLDYLTHLKIREEVINMHSFYQKTTIMVTHFIDDALIMADRIIVLGERPAKVIMAEKLDFPRPRNIEREQGLCDLRDKIFLMLGVSYVA